MLLQLLRLWRQEAMPGYGVADRKKPSCALYMRRFRAQLLSPTAGSLENRAPLERFVLGCTYNAVDMLTNKNLYVSRLRSQSSGLNVHAQCGTRLVLAIERAGTNMNCER